MAILPYPPASPATAPLSGYLWLVGPTTRRQIAGVLAELESTIPQARARPDVYVRHTEAGPELYLHDRLQHGATIRAMQAVEARYCRMLPSDCSLAGWRTVSVWATTPGPDGVQSIAIPVRPQ